MNKLLFKFTGAAVVSTFLLIAFYSCSDTWDAHYKTSSTSGSNQTLLARIESDNNLSDFKEVLDSVKVFRETKQTSVSYSDLLNEDQSFTVWAPVNGTFDKDSLLALCQTTDGNFAVAKHFVKNHIARYPYSVGAGVNKSVEMLNQKKEQLTPTTMGGVKIDSSNLVSKNGILHIISSQLPFSYNIYEALTEINEFSPIGDFLKAYETKTLDISSSVPSGIVDGQTVYVDSVMNTYNMLLDDFGPIDSNDSTYWLLAPTKTAWNDAYTTVSSYFNYAYVLGKDSLQSYYTNHSLLEDLIFNAKTQPSPKDSLMSTQYSSMSTQYSSMSTQYSSDPTMHVFYHPYASDGIFSTVFDSLSCGNGTIYKITKWPLNIQNVFFAPIKVEAERTSNLTSLVLATANTRNITADSISGQGYLDIVPKTTSAKWVATFSIPNTLSGTYDVCIVLLPKSVFNAKTTDFKPNKFLASLSYYDVSGTKQSITCNNYNLNNTDFTNNAYRVDTVKLCTFSFPTCNYGQQTATVSLKLTCDMSTADQKTYSREIYIDCIYLKPNVANK